MLCCAHVCSSETADTFVKAPARCCNNISGNAHAHASDTHTHACCWLQRGSYCLGVFDNGRQGTLLGGITFRNVLVQVRPQAPVRF